MTMARSRFAAAALASAISLGWAGAGLAQDKPKDDALDRLLEKLEGGKPAPDAESAPKPKKEEAKKDDAKKADAKKDASGDKAKAKPKAKPTEDEPKDKALDGLLEKLGETKEEPKTTGPSGDGKPDGHDEPAPGGSKPEDKTADSLRPDQKPLDEHLEELTERVKKKKNQQEKDAADDKSALGQAVKKMREVETKLGETDTGEETRKKQGEIIKDLDTLIAQAKKAGQGGGKPGRKIRQAGPPNGQQGNQPGSQGNTAQGAGPMKTITPKNAAAQVGDKNTWGNLPAMLRDEMDNVFRAEALPAKVRQISRYYEAVSKKSLSSRGQ